MDQSLSCESYSDYEKRQVWVLSSLDRWCFALIGPIVFMFLLGVILIFVANHKYKKSPGDIIMAMNSADLIQTIIYQIIGWYAIIYGMSPNPDGSLCQISGALNIITNIYQILFDYAFAFSPILFISSLLKNNPGIYRTIVFITFVVIASLAIINFFIEEQVIGLSPYGLCSFENNNIVLRQIYLIIYFFILLFYIITAIIARQYFQSRLPKTTTLQQTSQYYMHFYVRFILITICTYIINFVTQSIQTLDCIFYDLQEQYVISIHNLVKLITPLLQCIVILLYYKFNVTSDTPIDSIELQKNRQQSMAATITSEVKTITLYSILSGILLINQQQTHDSIIYSKDDDTVDYLSQSQYSFENSGIDHFNEEDAKSIAELSFNEQMVKDNLTCHLHGQPILPMQVISHAHDIFRYFQNLDLYKIDIADSLNLIKNIGKMKQLEGPKSGKSGEFFYFSYDDKLIIKTIKQSELISFRKIFKNYGNYLYNNVDSYITKIYGVYTFKSMRSENIIILMKNLTMGIPRESVVRQFDLKGSEYDREVLNKNPQGDLRKMVLKDLDFFKTEQKIWVDEQQREGLKYQFLKDSSFLKQCRLIDYSLFLLKIDIKGQSIKDNKNIIISDKEEGICYAMGIIDYLQEWNVKKGLEREMKRVIEYQSEQQVSVQHPNVYGDRFYEKLIERILS